MPHKLPTDCLIVIPARFDSTRLPGKPLKTFQGEALILQVCKNVRDVGADFFVATDNEEINQTVISAGYKSVISNRKYLNGSERVFGSVIEIFGTENVPEFIINVQCDEPQITADDILLLIKELENGAEICTLTCSFENMPLPEKVENNNIVKVLVDDKNFAKNFYRQVDKEPYFGNKSGSIRAHIGAYGFKGEIIKELMSLSPSESELQLQLEQLRWLENGYKIKCVEVPGWRRSINIEEDLH